jgi:hypothetical protein
VETTRALPSKISATTLQETQLPLLLHFRSLRPPLFILVFSLRSVSQTSLFLLWDVHLLAWDVGRRTTHSFNGKACLARGQGGVW